MSQQSVGRSAPAPLPGRRFVFLTPHGAEFAAAKLRNNMRDLFKSESWPVSASIGAVVFLAPPQNVDQAIKLADACMYRVKNGGKDGFFLLEWKG